MKRIFVAILILTMILISVQSHADLYNRGIDSMGNRLIYDSDLNITWYDYVTPTQETWEEQINWADNLAVNFGGNIYDDWRLPVAVDGPSEGDGYDGTTYGGYNVITSEFGHLYYSELGNIGAKDIEGNWTNCYICMTNTGPFNNLLEYAGYYWTGTEQSSWPGRVWGFYTSLGLQTIYSDYNKLWAIAVHPGVISVVPEPVSSILFVTGGTILGFRRFRKTKR